MTGAAKYHTLIESLNNTAIVLVGSGEETTNPSQVDGLHVVGFGKKAEHNLIGWISMALNFVLYYEI